MDEPESTGVIGMAAREHLEDLIFVVNCNLQRLDGPVRGNGKVMQELEALFQGAGWCVIKLVWGGKWDALLERDHSGALIEQIRAFIPGRYVVLGTDGFGRSDTRAALRHFKDKCLPQQTVADAIAKYGLDPAKPNPVLV
jgi:pyruvate dehydrogenase complex dehydrogenase (E1) component